MVSIESVGRDACARIMRAVEDGVSDLVVAARSANPVSIQLLEADLASARERARAQEITISDMKRDFARQTSSLELELTNSRKALQEHERELPKLKANASVAENQVTNMQSLLQQHDTTISKLKSEAMHQTIVMQVDLAKAQDTVRSQRSELESLKREVANVSMVDVHRRLTESREAELKAKEALAAETIKVAEMKSNHVDDVSKLRMQRDQDIVRLTCESAKNAEAQRQELFELKTLLETERSRNHATPQDITQKLTRAIEAEANANKAIADERARTACLKLEHHIELHALRTVVNDEKAQTLARIDVAVKDEREKFRIQSDSMMAQLGKQGGEIELLKAMNALLQKQAPKSTPGEIGTAGEDEIEGFLKTAFGGFMTVRNVSKIGQGHEMDLELTTRDGSIKIRIDVKNGQTIQEQEITRFYSDILEIKPTPTAAILFTRCALKCINPDTLSLNIDKKRRDGTLVIQIGCWAREMLIESIIDVVVERKMDLAAENKTAKPSKGIKEIGKTIEALSDVVIAQNKTIAAIHKTAVSAKSEMAERSRIAAETLRMAHSANPAAVREEVIATFEKKTPKRGRGHPQKYTSFFADVDSDGSDRPKKRSKRK